MRRARSIFLAVLAFFATVALVCAGVAGPCWSAWALSGVLVESCPTGSVRPVAHVQVNGLGRLEGGTILVGVTGQYLGRHGPAHTAVRRFSAQVVAIDPDGKELPMTPESGLGDAGWDGGAWGEGPDAASDQWQSGRFLLPAGPDGDWIIRVKTSSPAGDATVDATLPVYAPALAHVLTDAPLYKPGQVMQFRAVLLHEGDLTPLAARPGRWKVYSPDGELVLDEKGRTSALGVAASTFPLDAEAPPGPWRVCFESGGASDEATVEVRAFQLPRMTVEAAAEAPWWGVGSAPVVSGTVRYTSGAPVGLAPVRVRFGASGGWPPPPEWLEDRTVVTDRDGRFRIALAPVPADLVDVARIAVALEAQDASGAVARGGASVVLSADPIGVSAVTELADGVVPDTNNRLYVRVTSPDGIPLRESKIKLQKAWDPDDVGLTVTSDVDGVARFQVDPGQPTTVVVPPMPVRPAAADTGPRITLQSARDALGEESLGVEARVTLDRWMTAFQPCADRVPPEGRVNGTLVVRIDAAGAVRAALAGDGNDADPLAVCLAAVARSQRGPAGADRIWALELQARDADVPWVDADSRTLTGTDPGVSDAVDTALRSARSCVRTVRERLVAPTVWMWEATKGSTALRFSPLNETGDMGRLDPGTAACVARIATAAQLGSPASGGASGLLRLSVGLPSSLTPATPEPTTFPGFAFRVTAFHGDAKVGTTVLRMHPGTVPPLRLRMSEVIVDPGAKVELTAVRGPGWSGSFPKKLSLMQGDQQVLEFDFDPDRRIGSFTVPKEIHGFVSVSWADARALLYVRSQNDLAVTVAADRPVYRPGESATLTVTTRDPGGPVRAGVTLSGVDATLATLAPLPTPDAFARITVKATSDAPAFGVLDARALQTGQIAGEFAAQAAVLRVTSTPGTPPGAIRASGSGHGTFDRDGEAADAFYALYANVRTSVRSWEGSAPAGETMTPKKMVDLWESTLRAHPAQDPFGNELHLSRVPKDLLPLTDPRILVADSARLPEDTENWSAYVTREAP